MATRFMNIDRDTPMLLPVDLRDWIPADHIVHFILDAVGTLETSLFCVNAKGSGSEQYPPQMMLALLIYSYATGRFSSRDIERATHTDVAVRYICGGEHHPDHDTICEFRRRNRQAFEAMFVKVLLLAQESKCLKKVGTIAVDGTKILANASKHAAISYERAGKQIEMLQAEVKALTAKAEKADETPLEDGYRIPKEIQRRQDRIATLQKAKELIEKRFAEQPGKEDVEEVLTPKGAGKSKVPGKMQRNFTDPDSRIMKAGNGFEQAYNAQAAVDTASMLIVGQHVTQSPNDKQQLVPTVECVSVPGYTPKSVLADSGFYSEEAVKEVEQEGGPQVYASQGRTHHGLRVEDMERKPEPAAPACDAPIAEQMKYRLTTKKGKKLYGLRKQTVEPVFGIIKQAMGFRQFLLRGLQNVKTEWSLVCLAFNTRRLFSLRSAELALAMG
jgi:transposase